jgi:hypothetical protein
MFVVWPPSCTGGNEACDVSVGSSIVKTSGSVREEAGNGAPLACGESPQFSTELPVRVLCPHMASLCVGALERIS